MTDGMRRPPRLWEQKLEGMIRVAGVTGFGSAGSSVVVPGPTPGPDGPGSEPAPPPVVDPDPSTPRIPSTPVVAGTTLGLTVIWDGKDTTGVLFPKGTTVEVHVSGTTGFTPSSGTLKGTITEAGGSLLVGGIAAGSTFYVKFIAVYADGQKSDPSAQGSAMVGLVQGPEINGDAVITQIVAGTTPVTTYKLGSIWINTTLGTYNVLESVGGTPTWVKKEWKEDAIAANAISANQIAAQAITTKFLTGEIIRTGPTDAARVQISAANGIEVFRDATNKTFWAKPSGEVVFGTTSVSSGGVTAINGSSISTGTISADRIDVDNLTVKKLQSDTFSNPRVVIGAVGETSGVSFKRGGTSDGWILSHGFIGDDLSLARSHGSPAGTSGDFVIVAPVVAQTFRPTADRIVFQGYRETTTAGDVIMRLSSNVTSTNQAKFEVDADGDVKSRTNSYAGFSDARYKDNITPARDYLDDLREVEVVTFNWQGSDQKLLGVTAQQIQPIFPNMVAEDEDGTLSVRYSVFVPMLITAVQSLADRVDDLTARIEALEANQG